MTVFAMGARESTSTLAAMICTSVPAASPDALDQRLSVGLRLIHLPLLDMKVPGLDHAFRPITDHHTQRPPLRL